MATRQYSLPDSEALFPAPLTDLRAWKVWGESACTDAVIRGIWREIHRQATNRTSDSATDWAERQGVIKGLKKALAIIEAEEDASRQKAEGSAVEGEE